jgi:hypothetical protein
MNGYEMLAAAVVERAVLDYKQALENIRAKYNVLEAQNVIRNLERFFRSEWFSILSDLDGEMLVQQLRTVV